jgi:hypothetical protein
MKASRLTLLIFCLGICSGVCAQPKPIAVGSKNFTEGYVLAEVMAQLLESRDIRVERKFGFGGTLVAFEALRAGEIDVYAEYTGTISQGILGADAALGDSSLNAELAPLGRAARPRNATGIRAQQYLCPDRDGPDRAAIWPAYRLRSRVAAGSSFRTKSRVSGSSRRLAGS